MMANRYGNIHYTVINQNPPMPSAQVDNRGLKAYPYSGDNSIYRILKALCHFISICWQYSRLIRDNYILSRQARYDSYQPLPGRHPGTCCSEVISSCLV